MPKDLNRLRVSGHEKYRWVPEEQVVQMLILAGWAYDQKSDAADRESRQALQAWTELGLPCAFAKGSRLFDPVEVTNFLKWAGLTGQHAYWEERYLTTGRRFVRDLAAPAIASQATARLFHVALERTFYLSDFPPDQALRLRVPLPWEGHHLRDLQVQAHTSRNDQVLRHPGKLEVRAPAGKEGVVKVSAQLTFQASCHEPGPTSTPADSELYLRPRDGLVVVSPRIRELAAQLAGSGVAPAQALRHFWEYINEELVCGALHYDQLDPEAPADHVIETGWFDCQVGAAFLVSLCRAQGIPARLKGGRVLYPFAPANHYWAEAWLDDSGWTPFDLLSWDLSRGGRDEEWRDCFFGRLDQRMTTECLPREFTGSIGVPIPRVWTLLQRGRDSGLETTMMGGPGKPIYTDWVRVESHSENESNPVGAHD